MARAPPSRRQPDHRKPAVPASAGRCKGPEVGLVVGGLGTGHLGAGTPEEHAPAAVRRAAPPEERLQVRPALRGERLDAQRNAGRGGWHQPADGDVTESGEMVAARDAPVTDDAGGPAARAASSRSLSARAPSSSMMRGPPPPPRRAQGGPGRSSTMARSPSADPVGHRTGACIASPRKLSQPTFDIALHHRQATAHVSAQGEQVAPRSRVPSAMPTIRRAASMSRRANVRDAPAHAHQIPCTAPPRPQRRRMRSLPVLPAAESIPPIGNGTRFFGTCELPRKGAGHGRSPRPRRNRRDTAKT